MAFKPSIYRLNYKCSDFEPGKGQDPACERAAAHKDAALHVGQGLFRESAVVEALLCTQKLRFDFACPRRIGRLGLQPLVCVHRSRFGLRDAEEGGIELLAAGWVVIIIIFFFH